MKRAPISPEEELRRGTLLEKLMQHVGFAVWQVQAVEDVAAYYLTMRVTGSKGMGRDKAHALLKKAQKKTFGTLVNDLVAAGVLEKALADRLTGTVRERNWLVHQGRRDTRGILTNAAMYDSVLRRVDELSANALSLQTQLKTAVTDFVASSGVDMAAVEAHAEELAEAWGLR